MVLIEIKFEDFAVFRIKNFEEKKKNLFNDVSDLNYIFLRLQLAYGVQLVERKSLIVFDEVQFQPLARQAIKSFVEDHRYDYIETGSLISIRKNTEHILIPSEEQRISMYPMDYEEFRWAMGDTATIPLLRSVWEPTESEKHNYEVDFLLSRGTKILPIEVKSSSYKTHASLDAFCKKFSSRITNDRCLIYTKDYVHEGCVKYLPAYLAFFL